MFLRKLKVERIDEHGEPHTCPIKQLDTFAMRNFTNDAIFDDTLPIADGLLEAGNRVPLKLLQEKMQEWFRRKSYIAAAETLRICELQLGDAE